MKLLPMCGNIWLGDALCRFAFICIKYVASLSPSPGQFIVVPWMELAVNISVYCDLDKGWNNHKILLFVSHNLLLQLKCCFSWDISQHQRSQMHFGWIGRSAGWTEELLKVPYGSCPGFSVVSSSTSTLSCCISNEGLAGTKFTTPFEIIQMQKKLFNFPLTTKTSFSLNLCLFLGQCEVDATTWGDCKLHLFLFCAVGLFLFFFEWLRGIWCLLCGGWVVFEYNVYCCCPDRYADYFLFHVCGVCLNHHNKQGIKTYWITKQQKKKTKDYENQPR